jgi:hypothetical protein
VQESSVFAIVPQTLPLQNVPAIAQQILPPLIPEFIPLKDLSFAARHTPSFTTLFPLVLFHNACTPSSFDVLMPFIPFFENSAFLSIFILRISYKMQE